MAVTRRSRTAEPPQHNVYHVNARGSVLPRPNRQGPRLSTSNSVVSASARGDRRLIVSTSSMFGALSSARATRRGVSSEVLRGVVSIHDKRGDLTRKCIDIDRLGNKSVTSRFLGAALFSRHRVGGDRDNCKHIFGPLFPYGLSNLIATHTRHLHVQKHHVKVFALE